MQQKVKQPQYGSPASLSVLLFPLAAQSFLTI